MGTDEWKLKNYLNKHEIYKGDSSMQTVIINSFYDQHNAEKGRHGTNQDPWKKKLLYVDNHFGLFAQYAQNEWKEKEPSTN